MKTFIIAYDLLSDVKDYNSLINEIESYPNHYKVNKSTWLLKTSYSRDQIFNSLRSKMDSNDSLFVSELTLNAMWINVEEGDTELKQAF